jgi:hypothetical protein
MICAFTSVMAGIVTMALTRVAMFALIAAALELAYRLSMRPGDDPGGLRPSRQNSQRQLICWDAQPAPDTPSAPHWS